MSWSLGPSNQIPPLIDIYQNEQVQFVSLLLLLQL
jgi:hypothetical protein